MVQQPDSTRPRSGYTLVELLVSMALLVFIMAIVSEAFTAGLETFRQLKGTGDMSEELREAAVKLRDDVAEVNRRVAGMITTGLTTGSVDPKVVEDLQRRYGAIQADAAALDPKLREVLRRTTNPVARRVMKITLHALAGVKESAGTMLEILDLFDPD